MQGHADNVIAALARRKPDAQAAKREAALVVASSKVFVLPDEQTTTKEGRT